MRGFGADRKEGTRQRESETREGVVEDGVSGCLEDPDGRELCTVGEVRKFRKVRRFEGRTVEFIGQEPRNPLYVSVNEI